MNMKAHVFALISILICLKGVSSLSCYQCDSNTEPDCEEHFDHNHLSTLTIQSTECTVDAAKYCIKTTGVWEGIVGTKRFCSSRDMFNQCQFVRYPDHDRVYRACIYTCSGDHCNGAPPTTARIQPVLLFLALAHLLLFKYLLRE